MTRRLGVPRAVFLATAPLLALVAAAVLQSALLRRFGLAPAGPGVLALPVVALVVVPVAAYRRTRSVGKTLAVSALAAALASLGVFVLVVALLASVGEN